MAKKMYYTEEEAAQALGIRVDELAEYVRDQRLRVFKDGDKNMYKGEEVEALGGGEEEIELAPAEDVDTMAKTVVTAQPGDEDVELTQADEVDTMAKTVVTGKTEPDDIALTVPDEVDTMAKTVLTTPGEGSGIITLADTEEPDQKPGGKEDTVITAEGISIFDEEDLEIETADPMAKTQIAPSLEDQISVEGVGSGSGLLDLTRESDDTSLGAELLDHIDLEEPTTAPAAAEAAVAPYPVQPEIIVDPSQITEAPDPIAGLFSGILIACFAVALLIGGVMLAGVSETMPEYVVALDKNVMAVLLGGLAVAGVAGVVGLFLGKSAAARRA